jgi:transcription initiation factor IIE alpha subunit
MHESNCRECGISTYGSLCSLCREKHEKADMKSRITQLENQVEALQKRLARVRKKAQK